MTTYNKTQLKTFFETGDVPTGTDYANLIDSCVNIVETASQTLAGPLNPTELVTARVSAGNANVTGTMTIAGQTSAENVNVGGGLSVSGASTLAGASFSGTVSAGALNCADVSANVVWVSGARFSVLTVNASGTTQATAAPLTATINIGAGMGDGSQTGFILGANQPGRLQYIINGTVSGNLWPCVGGQINALSSNAAFGLTANTLYTIIHTKASGYAVK